MRRVTGTARGGSGCRCNGHFAVRGRLAGAFAPAHQSTTRPPNPDHHLRLVSLIELASPARLPKHPRRSLDKIKKKKKKTPIEASSSKKRTLLLQRDRSFRWLLFCHCFPNPGHTRLTESPRGSCLYSTLPPGLHFQISLRSRAGVAVWFCAEEIGKKRASAVSAAGAPVFPFPADAAAGDPDHFSDYGFDPQLVGFFAQPEPKRPSWSKRRHQPPPPLESARFKLQKPISKRPQHQQKQQQQRRRRWWSSAASAALLLFKRPCSSSSSSSSPAVARAPPPSAPSASVVMPMYLADDDDGGEAACACWAPAMRSGRLAAAELGASAALVPYVSLRAGGADGGAPAVPMYLVT